MFEGFSQEALDFLNDIRFNNNQAFYAANQARYERFVKRPMRELSDELAPVVQLIDPKLDTRPGRTMSRIRRDTRYTKDKSRFGIMRGWAGAIRARGAARASTCIGASGRIGSAGDAVAIIPISR